jgi:hypothetical protein
VTHADISDHLGRGTELCVPTTSMVEGERFDTLFQKHLRVEVSSGFVVAVCFVRWFSVSVV